MRIGSLFSGYGGLDLAVQAVLGGEVAWHVEYDKAPSRILDHHWPDVPNYGDVTQLDFTSIEPVDILTGGYPCQPFSHAGKRKGTDDDRHLWPHVLRAIREMGPRLAILENVRGHLSLGFDSVLADLADVGWSARWGVVRASDAGAPHQRARLFIAAYPDRGRREQHHQGERLLQLPDEDRHDAAADAIGGRRSRGAQQSQREPESRTTAAGGGQDFPADADSASRKHGVSRMGVSDLEGCDQPPADADDSALIGRVQPRVGSRHDVAGRSQGDCGVDWADYAPAIYRWEHVVGRPAPAPTEPGRTGAPRLSPRFVEWMMGLPDGWVTDPDIGISRNDQLKALGNGVVPQQAALAIDALLSRCR